MLNEKCKKERKQLKPAMTITNNNEQENQAQESIIKHINKKYTTTLCCVHHTLRLKKHAASPLVINRMRTAWLQ